MDLRRKNLELFWERFYEDIFTKNEQGLNHIINYDIQFIKDFTQAIDKIPHIGRPAREATQMMFMTFDRTYFDRNKIQQKYILIDYFSQDILYDFFIILKKLLTTNNYMITKDEYDFILTHSKNESIFLNIFAFSIDKVLMNIYTIWNKNYDVYITKNNDIRTIDDKYTQILRKYQISESSGSKPHFGLARPHSTSLTEKFFNSENHHWLLITWFTGNNFDCVKEIHDYLCEYFSIIEENELSIELSKKKIATEKPKKTTKKTEESLLSLLEEAIQEAPKKATKEKKTKEPKESTVSLPSNEEAGVEPPKKEKKKTSTTKKEKDKIPKPLRAKVWATYIGEKIGTAKCFCCELAEITMLNFDCGHVIAEHNGGEVNLDNLRPICKSCNSSMGTMNMFQYIEKYGFHSKK